VTGMLVSAGASSVAHGVHYSVLGIGLLGLVVLLAPPRTPSRHRAAVPDDHARRIAELRRSVAAGTIGATSRATSVVSRPIATTSSRQTWLPLAVVSTAVAASVHAAVGPAHFREQTLFGLFFALSALAQLTWSVAMVVRASPRLLAVGAVGNVGLAVLWLATRTVGLPGLLPGPESVGAWDLACVVSELVAAVACVQALGARTSYRLESWAGWDRRVQAWTCLSIVGLGLLSISGAGS
jgi:hypothetical protein